MVIERDGEKIRFRFEDHEREMKKSDEFIFRIAPLISDPWNSVTKFWTIDKKHEAFFQELREELFADPNQPKLF